MILATTPPRPTSLPISNTSTEHRRLIIQILTKCTSISQLKQVHGYTLRTTSLDHPDTLFLYSRIIHFASLNNDLHYTFKLFTYLDNPNSFIWNTLIRACAHSNDRKAEAFLLFHRMITSVEPDKHTFPFVLKSCAYLFALSQGKQAHGFALKLGLASDVCINNSLVHFYSSSGCLKDAKDVFDKMPERSLVSWNVMIDALVQSGAFENALRMFSEMQMMFEPDGYTMQSVLDACAGLGTLSLGMWAHAYILRNYESYLDFDLLVNNCLLNMYCKCGSLRIAVQVFERMSKRDLNSWNAMILGLAMHGEVEAAFRCFSQMVNKRVMPDSITFVGILSACNHRGLVDEGHIYFDKMVSEYKIRPVLEHYGCLVDLLARAGCIDKALDVVSNMPMKPDAAIWRSLLDGCCKKNAEIQLSEEMARKVIESEGSDTSGVYVLLSRVYATANRWDEAGLIRKLMTDKGIKKDPGCSSIEINGVFHEFFAGDTSHLHTREIYEFLDVIEERLKSARYVPDLSQASMVDELDIGKRQSLKMHIERLAMAYGLLKLKPGTPIRIFKNLRICSDCHKVTKLISAVFDVEIIVRDRVRFHHFRNGSCTCKDHW
ncbi:pentatricopeptide repeat-containing protein At1g59720, chloroplastic/mitochondrial-like [Lycium barbarum]|uniref:pentatricopeptide repeat-containing protein At1g59720, chloroplastic/mitochondrial-like n=1 Tax=Lycium barbarum TaxID=112863 RepID=UPI00293F0302|nr:pentatricopeptide repeat-containing protein At1g59720, chloroplastic/mitochondrial-like [Lycium barbarum]